MSSSDSEDCYGNVAKTLQSLKSQYKDDKLSTANLLKDADVSKNNTTTATDSLATVSKVSTLNEFVDTTLSDDEELDKIIALNSKRRTRSSNRRSAKDSPDTFLGKRQSSDPAPTRSKRTRNKTSVYDSDSINPPNCSDTTDIATSSPSRGNRGRRGRGRGRARSRGRGSASRSRSLWLSSDEGAYPIFSVGNTDDYPDESDGVQLFSTKNTPTVTINLEESDVFDENEELSVKVLWQSSEIFKFTIRKFQKILQIFEFFSKKFNVNIDKLLFTYNDKILKSDDTPDTINYSVAKFIDGGIVQQNVTKLVTSQHEKHSDGIKLRFQYPNSKKPFEISIEKDDTLSLAMIKCAEYMEMPLKSLKFEFDGDSLSGKSTARDLDMEGGECIDVKILR